MVGESNAPGNTGFTGILEVSTTLMLKSTSFASSQSYHSAFQSGVASGMMVTGDWRVCGSVLTRSMLSWMKMMLGDLLYWHRRERVGTGVCVCVCAVRRKSCAR